MNNAYSFSVIFFEKYLPEFKAPALGGKQLAGKDSQINDLAAEIAALKKQLAAQQK